MDPSRASGVPEPALTIEITPEGDTRVPFFPPEFSKFVVENLYTDEERQEWERHKGENPTGMIFCG